MSKHVVIIASLDQFANRIKPLRLSALLERRGHRVTLIDVFFLHRAGHGIVDGSKRRLPALDVWSVWSILLGRVGALFGRRIWELLLPLQMRARARVLTRVLERLRPDSVVCFCSMDSLFILENRPYTVLYNPPNPWAEEMHLGGHLSDRGYQRLLRVEREVYRAAEYLSFDWPSTSAYVRSRIYDGENFFPMYWGCDPKDKRASFSSPARIVYLGYLGGYWANLPLLAALSKQVPIDVYGAPAPDPALGLRYRGYAHPDVVADYQFGLITITDDALRKEGFSAKHLEYASYGLPVLLPSWRNDAVLKPTYVPFTERDFSQVVAARAKKSSWNRLHQACLRFAKEYSWDAVLLPAVEIIERSSRLDSRE